MDNCTRQGHGHWGRELLEHMSADEARFYLSLHSPELSEANFQLDVAMQYVIKNIRKPMANFMAKAKSMGISHSNTLEKSIPIYVDNLDARMRFYSDPPNFSSQRLVKILQNILNTYFEQSSSCSDECFRNVSPIALHLTSIFMPDYFDTVRSLLHSNEGSLHHA